MDDAPHTPLLFTVDGGLARLTLNRPASLNAFDVALAHAWRDAALEAVARDDVRAVLVDATGPAFCAGGDVRAMAADGLSGADIAELARMIGAGIRALTASVIPVVTAAHGTTAGGGLGILLAGDYAVAGVSSRIGSRYAGVGLTPDLSVSAQLARAIGERRALQLLLDDRMLTGEEAREWGLVAEVVAGADPVAEAEAVRARAEEVARGWVAGAAAAYGQAKRLVRSRPERSFEEQLEEEARTIGAAFDTPDARARVAAFGAGRPAHAGE